MTFSSSTKLLKVMRPDELHLDIKWAAYCQRSADEEGQCFLEWARRHHTDRSGRPYAKLRGKRCAVAVHFGPKLAYG